MHISNGYYDLRPVLRATAARLGLAGAHVTRIDGLARDQEPSQYVALARDAKRLEPLLARGWTRLAADDALAGATPWTDDHVNVLEALVADW
jgi:hypothetical protein